jgi:hypothetical protein
MDPAYQQAAAWAQTELSRGTQPEALVSGLMGQGWSELQARQVLDAALTGAVAVAAPIRTAPVMSYASPAKRPSRSYTSSGGSSHHARNMLIGGAVCAVGTVITVGTYAAASGGGGGRYTICWGAMVFGFIQFIRGFAGWMSGG